MHWSKKKRKVPKILTVSYAVAVKGWGASTKLEPHYICDCVPHVESEGKLHTYIGLTEGTFKMWRANHISSFRNTNQRLSLIHI